MQRIIGEVVMFSDFRGYGFIRCGKKPPKDYFVHVSSIHSAGLQTLDVGEVVEFMPRTSSKGLQAIDVRVISSETQPKAQASSWVLMKKNPFCPQDPITDPNKFAGRKQVFQNAVDAIYNNKNLLISGPRGIGKSSLSYQLLYLAEGQNDLANRLDVDLGGETFDHICGDHRCVPGNTLADIANGLISTLARGIGSQDFLKGTEINCEIDLKYFKAGSKEIYENISTTDLSLKFAEETDRIFKKVNHKARGVTFLLDEVDVLLEDTHLAPFLKATTEKLRLAHHLDVSFIVSGVTGTITDLLSQHASSSRLFEAVPLGKMEPDELAEILELCLVDTGVDITTHAKTRIVGLANNFPQPVHLLGYHAFRLDGDASIDTEDVNKARDFVVQNLKRQDFEAHFNRLKQGPMLEAIRTFAASRYETVNMPYLRKTLHHRSEREIFGTLGGLEESGIIERQGSGRYRFRDPLFRVYLRWVFGIDDH